MNNLTSDLHDFKQLYDFYPYQKTARVKVIAVEELEKADELSAAKFIILTDETIFYPEGGGQAGDTGYLYEITNSQSAETSKAKKVRVLDTRYAYTSGSSEAKICHFTDSALPLGSEIEQRIDWERRFTHSQQHSTEHIISGLVHKKYAYKNVGFHLGRTETTIDFDGPLSYTQIQEIVAEANQIVWSNQELKIRVYTAEEAKSINYRSKIDLDNLVRLIEIPGADISACCGTHVKSTGEIGLIICTNIEAYKGGSRITFYAGTRAFKYVRKQQEVLNTLVQTLNLPFTDLNQGVERLDNRILELESTIKDTAESLWQKSIADITQDTIIHIQEKIFSPKQIKRLFKLLNKSSDDNIHYSTVENSDLKSYTNPSILVFLAQNENLSFFLFEDEAKYNSEISWFTYLKSEYSARGGGNHLMTQGQIRSENISPLSQNKFIKELAKDLNAKIKLI